MIEQEFKTFEYAERNGDSVIIFSELNEDEAQARLNRIVKNPYEFRLVHMGDE